MPAILHEARRPNASRSEWVKRFVKTMTDTLLTAQAGSVDSPEEYWRSQFPTRVQLVSLPFDKSPPPMPSFLRETVEFSLDRECNAGLHGLSLRLAVPPLAILLAALKTVLFRYARQEKLVVGTAVPIVDSFEKSRDALALVPIQTHWDSPNELSAEELTREIAICLTGARTNSQVLLERSAVPRGRKGFRIRGTAVQRCVVRGPLR